METVWCFQLFSPGVWSSGWMMHGFIQLLVLRTWLSSPFCCCFCCYGNDSPLACHWSAVKKSLDVRRFFRKVKLFQLEKTLWAAEKDAGGGVLKALRLVCRRKHGLVHALGPGSGVGVFDASVPPQGGGGSNRGGVNGLYLGVLLSFVVWELTEWWGGVVFPLLWVWWAAPGCHGPGSGWAWAPRPGQIWGNGVPMGVSGGAGSRGGGILPPLMFSSPVLRLHFSRSITPTHR